MFLRGNWGAQERSPEAKKKVTVKVRKVAVGRLGKDYIGSDGEFLERQWVRVLVGKAQRLCVG